MQHVTTRYRARLRSTLETRNVHYFLKVDTPTNIPPP